MKNGKLKLKRFLEIEKSAIKYSRNQGLKEESSKVSSKYNYRTHYPQDSMKIYLNILDMLHQKNSVILLKV